MSSDPADPPPHLRPFVLPHQALEPVASGGLDLYLPGNAPAPAVLMVHGGPVPPDRPVRPPQWPAYRAYGALLAQAGLVGAMFEHGFVDDDSLEAALSDVRRAWAELLEDPRVDPDRCGLWFFSAGGLLMGTPLADPAAWRAAAVAGTYAAVAIPDGEEIPGDLPEALGTAELSDVPLLLVRPEHDFDWIAPFTDDLLARCRSEGRAVDVIDVAGAHHGFETVDDTDAAREAIRASVSWWADALR